ncbi:hypothetical protein MTO96_028734 [Rhipicephalus appendiculatus]
MICTLGESFNRSSLAFPDDGICTLIFFDSLYTAGGVTLAPPYPDNFQYFLEGSRQYTKTESGIGFDYEKRKDVSALVGDPATKTHLDALWQSRVYHYGHLNTPPFMVSASDQVELLTSLQLIAGLMENLRDKNTRPVYKVLVFAFPDTMWAQETVERLRYMPVDILIGVSHQTVDDKNFADCTILPPTFMDSPGGSYPYSLRHWAEVFEEISKAALPTTLALSVGMYIRRYQPRYPGPNLPHQYPPENYTCGNQCTDFPDSQLLPSSAVCKDKWRYTTVYDSTYHLCKLKEEHWTLKFTVAAMGVEYADTTKFCRRDRYGHMNRVRSIVDFITRNFTSQGSFSACNS